MALNFFKIKKGTNLEPIAGTTVTAEGDLAYNDTSNQLEVFTTTAESITTSTNTQTLTNKTLTGNTATGFNNGAGTFTLNTTGAVTVPNTTDTLVGRNTTDVLTNKTLSGNTATNLVSGAGTFVFNTSGTITAPNATDTLVGKATTDTLTNKSISGATNTITNVSLTTAVTGTLPIANGGTGQTTASAAFDALSPMTTGGDLIYGGASGTGTRLPNGTAGQVLTSNGTTTAPSWESSTITLTSPTIQSFTSGSGTYTTPADVLYVLIEMVGGGGGGGGSGTSAGTNGTAGGTTTFGTSLLTATGGGFGNQTAGGTGGTPTVSSPAVAQVSLTGAAGDRGHGGVSIATVILNGGKGASSPLGGAGAASDTTDGGAAVANTGSGGGGAGVVGNVAGASVGASGGAGAYIRALISSPSATYSYAVGAAGTASAAGSNGSAGGAGGSGYIVVTEYYQ